MLKQLRHALNLDFERLFKFSIFEDSLNKTLKCHKIFKHTATVSCRTEASDTWLVWSESELPVPVWQCGTTSASASLSVVDTVTVVLPVV